MVKNKILKCYPSLNTLWERDFEWDSLRIHRKVALLINLHFPKIPLLIFILFIWNRNTIVQFIPPSLNMSKTWLYPTKPFLLCQYLKLHPQTETLGSSQCAFFSHPFALHSIEILISICTLPKCTLPKDLSGQPIY